MKSENTVTIKELEQWFIKNFGDSYRKMQKEKMARMLLNMWTNYSILFRDHSLGAKIWLKTKRQRDAFKEMLRNADGYYTRNDMAERHELEDK